MKFAQGFSKVAAFGHNNQGLEFKEYDTEPSGAVGPGGMAPSGIESYQPIEHDRKAREKDPKKKSKKSSSLDDSEVAQLMVHKLSSAGGDSYNEVGVGSRAAIAGTTVSQLKYESSAPWSLEQIGESAASEKERAKKYERAKRK